MANYKSIAPDWDIVATDDPAVLRSTATRAEVIYYIPNSSVSIRDLVSSAHKLLWIHSATQGVDLFMIPELLNSSVLITRSGGLQSAAIGEYTIGCVLALAKNFPRYIRNQVEHSWDPIYSKVISGMTLVIVGVGGIGTEVARRARALGMRTVGVDIRPQSEIRTEAVELLLPIEEIDKALQLADFLVLAVPLTNRTRGMIGSNALMHLKSTCYLINICRGPVVQEVSLIDALRKGQIAGAALDVMEVEPLPAESPLWYMPNVILTPHNCGQFPELVNRRLELFGDNFRLYNQGQPLLHVVNKERQF